MMKVYHDKIIIVWWYIWIMPLDIHSLYAMMLKSRFFEEAVRKLLDDGLVSGQIHLGTEEEAIDAGVLAQLVDGDAIALNDRRIPPLIMRCVDPVSIPPAKGPTLISGIFSTPEGIRRIK
jgi:TPP-dependent pyruvate/acetoin dehydrogenase alpha subunit